jgi:hypothetical protein
MIKQKAKRKEKREKRKEKREKRKEKRFFSLIITAFNKNHLFFKFIAVRILI